MKPIFAIALAAVMIPSHRAAAEDFGAVPGSGQFLEKPREDACAPLPDPQLSFTAESHPFGKIAAGIVVKHDFVFTNTSDTTVVIERVEPDCDCTTVGEWTAGLEPGKSGVIPVTYQSAGYHGPIDQTIKVYTDDATRPPVILHLKGEVWQPVELSPINARFMLGHASGEPVTRSVRVRTRLGELNLVSTPESSNKAFSVAVRTVVPGQDYYLDITTVGTLPAGLTEGEVTVKTSSENLPLVTIPVSAEVPDPVSCTPELIRLPPRPVSPDIARRVILRNHTAEPVTVKSATTNFPGTSVEIKEIRPGKLFHVFTRMPADLETKGKKLVLTILTDSKDRPEIQVPITRLKAGMMK